MMTRFRYNGTFWGMYLAFSRIVFLCALDSIASTIFKGFVLSGNHVWSIYTKTCAQVLEILSVSCFIFLS